MPPLASLLVRAEPGWDVLVCERLGAVAAEASHGWHNAGTGHAALCELNYTPADGAGRIDIGRAVDVHGQFLLTAQYWAGLVDEGALGRPATFLNPTPHLSFVRGADDSAYLEARHRALTRHHFFTGMEFADRHARIGEWAPLLTEGRDPAEAIAATRAVEGTDVDFGALTRQLFADVAARGVGIRTGAEAMSLSRGTDGWWSATLRDRATGTSSAIRARVVLVGAGGWTLKLLRSAGVRETRGYGLLPVSGTFLSSTDPAVTRAHPVKVYGKAPVGAPPMSMPHLDARVIDGERSVLFGPFAGAIPKYLTHGSVWDLAGAVRPDTVVPLATMGVRNLGLVSLLARDLLATHRTRVEALREFAPSACADRWRLLTAGQRAQIVKPDARGRGILQFGTEVITSAGGTIAGVLGASPGASTAVPIALDILTRCFPHRAERWERDRWRPYLPVRGHDLADDAVLTARTKQSISRTLELSRPE